ncbi:MAG TPA: hypothetical protein VNI78_13085 [Vicinamibacterales bacterium]|nr:hypothetical protein [Vicinamibacterales bacterium]
MKRGAAAVAAILAASAATFAAQWPKYPTPGLPRDAKGQVLMDAPAPRTADGKPDFSGVWMRADPGRLPRQVEQIVGDREREGTVAVDRPISPFPPDPDSPPVATFWELGANIPGGLPFTPWAAKLREARMAADSKDNPDANCLPMGITQFHMQPQPRKIVQTPHLLVIMYEANYGLRTIYLDGRPLPPQGEPQPWWYGYSVGRWEGDTLVVETNNLRGAESGPFDGWLDVNGSPYSDSARFIERFRRPTVGKLEIDVTVEDNKAYTKPFTVRINQRLLPDEEPIEFVCNENQQFRKRVKID